MRKRDLKEFLQNFSENERPQEELQREFEAASVTSDLEEDVVMDNPETPQLKVDGDQAALRSMFENAAPETQEPTQEDEMSSLQKFAVGAGRGMTDIGQTGRQLFEASPLGDLTDISSEDYNRKVRGERETYEEGLGEDTTANIGRFVGQVAPTIPLGMGAGSLAGRGASATGGRLAAPAAEGAVGGALIGGADQVGEDTGDIIQGAATGGTVGAISGAALSRFGRYLGNKADEGLSAYEYNRFVDELGDDIFQQLPRRSDGIVDFTKVPSQYVEDVGRALSVSEEGIRSRVGSLIPDALEAGKRGAMENLSLSPLNIAAGASSYALGGPLGVAAAGAARPAFNTLRPLVPEAAGAVGRGVLRSGQRFGQSQGSRMVGSEYLARTASDIFDADDEDVASKLHVRSQTDPAFLVAVNMALEEENQ